MKTCLVAINSSYTHTSLSLLCLKRAAQGCDVCTKEYTINDVCERVADDIYKTNSQVYAFSCYIWNIEFVKKVCAALKTIDPASKILLGGAEVSYDAKDVLEKNEFVDFVLCGEGELSFKSFVSGERYENISGLAYRCGREIVLNPPQTIADLSKLPVLYDEEELARLKGKIIYYETSRGCPYGCSFCLSSVSRGVRFFPLERVFEDFLLFDRCKVELVKLVDRTFNTDEKRTNEILKFIIENIKTTCFHFEISAHSLKQTTIELLKSAPKGKFQLEIGVRSTNEKTIKAINRTTNFSKLCQNVCELKQNRNIHIHLDLIAALPYENLESFKKSFNDVFALRPDMLQLGFLKLLKGSKIRNDAKLHNYSYFPYPPYEAVSNDYISYDEILILKQVCDMVEKYYNCGSFEKSLEYLLKGEKSAFELFYKLSAHYALSVEFSASQSKRKLYDILYEYKRDDNCFSQLLLFDFLKNNIGAALPYWAKKTDRYFAKRVSSFISDNKYVLNDNLKGEKLSNILKYIRIYEFEINVLGDMETRKTAVLFDYKNKTETEVFGIENMEDSDE